MWTTTWSYLFIFAWHCTILSRSSGVEKKTVKITPKKAGPYFKLQELLFEELPCQLSGNMRAVIFYCSWPWPSYPSWTTCWSPTTIWVVLWVTVYLYPFYYLGCPWRTSSGFRPYWVSRLVLVPLLLPLSGSSCRHTWSFQSTGSLYSGKSS